DRVEPEGLGVARHRREAGVDVDVGASLLDVRSEVRLDEGAEELLALDWVCALRSRLELLRVPRARLRSGLPTGRRRGGRLVLHGSEELLVTELRAETCGVLEERL